MSTDDVEFERMRVKAMADLRQRLVKIHRVVVALWVLAACSALALVLGIAVGLPVYVLMVNALAIVLCVWRAVQSGRFHSAAVRHVDHLDSTWTPDDA